MARPSGSCACHGGPLLGGEREGLVRRDLHCGGQPHWTWEQRNGQAVQLPEVGASGWLASLGAFILGTERDTGRGRALVPWFPLTREQRTLRAGAIDLRQVTFFRFEEFFFCVFIISSPFFFSVYELYLNIAPPGLVLCAAYVLRHFLFLLHCSTFQEIS